MFAGDLNDNTDGYTGTLRTAGELDYLTEAISTALDEIGGKVRRAVHSLIKKMSSLPPL